MTQTTAIFLDAYRELNARKMFWVTLILTALFMLIFAMFAPDGDEMTFLTFHWHEPHALEYYKANLLDQWVVGVWVSWIAVLLGLIATAGIIPDLIAGGSIDLYLSKPISRLRFFLTKYATALIFVAIQSTVFAVLAFVIVGVRAGEWKPGFFLTIPLLTLLFSYLYSFCALMGVVTRSLLATLTLTLVLWALVFGAHFIGDLAMLTFQGKSEFLSEYYARRAERAQREIDSGQNAPGTSTGFSAFSSARTTTPQERKATSLEKVEVEKESAKRFAGWHTALFAVKAVLPKTSDTISLMSREVIEDHTREEDKARELGRAALDFTDDERLLEQFATFEGALRATKIVRSRSATWIIGTSVGFELVILTLAAWLFCRRDY